jgi:hypothetical protein
MVEISRVHGTYTKAVYLLRTTTHGMPMRSAARTPGWLPATRMQFRTSHPTYSDPARRAAITFSELTMVSLVSEI